MPSHQEIQDIDAAFSYLTRLAGAWLITILRDRQIREDDAGRPLVAKLKRNEGGIHPSGDRGPFDSVSLEDFALSLLHGKTPHPNNTDTIRTLLDSSNNNTKLIRYAIDREEPLRGFSIEIERIKLIIDGSSTSSEGVEAGKGPAIGMEQIADLELRRDTKIARWRNERVHLTLSEFQTVDLLASQCGDNVAARKIFEILHGEGFVSGRGPDGYRENVRTLIKRIRQKFRRIDPTFDQIENYPRFGYRWRTDL